MNLTQETIGEFLKFMETDRLFYVDEVREWLRQYDKEEISFSKFVELFNLKFFRWYKAEAERAAIVEAEKDRLRLENERLIMENMTHEYNQAEAERFRPEYERQLLEQLTTERDAYKEALAEIKKECLNNHRGAMQSVNRIVKLINEILQKFNNTNQTRT